MDNQIKKRPIYDYYIGDTCYHSLRNRRCLEVPPDSLNPFHRMEYRIVDCKMVSSNGEKYITFTTLLSCGQTKIIKGIINDTAKELCKKIRKLLKGNEPVIIRFGIFRLFPYMSPVMGHGISIFTREYTLADISMETLSDKELEYYTAPFTKKEWMY